KNRLKSKRDGIWRLSFGNQLGTHAYAWTSARSPRICVACNNQVIPGAKLPRICVDITQPPTHMRSSLLSRQAAYAHIRDPTHMHQQPRICVAKHIKHHVET
ncbi:hypothetical protein PIB30_112747, partial [Stylosanthes scabra]|nr:hypothetical protein [Stylosanthes scabra]